MSLRTVQSGFPVGIRAAACTTVFGNARATHAALCRNEVGFKLTPVTDAAGSDLVPLALISAMNETVPPRWMPALDELVKEIPGEGWGTSRAPIFITSSNFGIGNLLQFSRDQQSAHISWSTAQACMKQFQASYGWGNNYHLLSHACVSAHLGLIQAARWLESGVADRALVFSFDFLSAFVTGGFHSLKILNSGFPAPYQNQAVGSIGLGDGAGFVVLDKLPADFSIIAQHCGNEMYHFTANEPEGSGFIRLAAPLQTLLSGQRIWIKGHGTGTLDAGRMESGVFQQYFPNAPLVGWKGSLGHTLGSCGLVELVIALESFRNSRAPGTVGAVPPFFTDTVQAESFALSEYDGALLCSNAFGGAHAALYLSHV